MARAEKQQKVLTVRALKKFLEDIPEKTPILGMFDDERIEATLWKADKDESGPRKWLSLEECM